MFHWLFTRLIRRLRCRQRRKPVASTEVIPPTPNRPADLVSTSPTGKLREKLIWVGDGYSPPTRDVVGRPITLGRRHGKVVEYTQLTITVEWD